MFSSGCPLLCLQIWKANANTAMQTLNLFAIAGFVLGPLVVKPLIGDEHDSNSSHFYDNKNQNNKTIPSFVVGINHFPTDSVTGSSKDHSTFIEVEPTTATSRIIYAFLVVAAFSLVIGVFLTLFLIVDVGHSGRSGAANAVDVVAGTPAKKMTERNFAFADVFDKRSYTSDERIDDRCPTTNEDLPIVESPITGRHSVRARSATPSRRSSFEETSDVVRRNDDDDDDDDDYDSASRKRRRFVVTVTLLVSIFNVFFGGMEVGYAGLLSTFAFKYLGWNRKDATDVTVTVQAAAVAASVFATVTSRCVRPQVGSNIVIVGH